MSTAARRRWTEREIRALGTRTDIPTAGSILAGLSSTQSYELAKVGRFPVPILKVGRRLIVPTAPILELLGLSDHGADQTQLALLRPMDDPDYNAALRRSGQGLLVPAAPP